MIPTDSKERKDAPVFSGFCEYWPDAMVEVARLSKFGNDKHNAGEPLHWAREKSNDHGDCLMRHQLEYDKKDEFGFYHAVAVAWRAMCQLQLLLEADKAKRQHVRLKPGQWYSVDSLKHLNTGDSIQEWQAWNTPNFDAWYNTAARRWAEDVMGDKYFFWLGNKS